MMNKYGYTYIYIIHEQLFRVYLKMGMPHFMVIFFYGENYD